VIGCDADHILRGLHDTLSSGQVDGAGATTLKTLMVARGIVVENGVIAGFDIERLRHAAMSVAKRIAA
jgi:hypothetical protein